MPGRWLGSITPPLTPFADAPTSAEGRVPSLAQLPSLRYGEAMCGRFIQYSDPGVYASHFQAELACEGPGPRYNLAPTQPVLAVRQAQDGRRELVPLRWGLVPGWSKGPDNRYSMINARAETVDTKPAYRNAFKHRRCLIPAEGFYE